MPLNNQTVRFLSCVFSWRTTKFLTFLRSPLSFSLDFIPSAGIDMEFGSLSTDQPSFAAAAVAAVGGKRGEASDQLNSERSTRKFQRMKAECRFLVNDVFFITFNSVHPKKNK